MLEKAMRLCEAACGMLVTFDGTRFQTAAHRGLPARFAEYVEAASAQPSAGGGQARVLRGEIVVHHVDMKDDDQYRDGTNPNHRAMVDLGGARTNLVVPLRKDDALLGTFTIYRQEVRPFTEKQIALLQNFAAQAVIAMENARLLSETREALDQQTATAEVLQVINSSPGNLAPVFESILDKAHALCGADRGGLILRDGERFHAIALHGIPDAFARVLRHGFDPRPESPVGRLLRGERQIHITDLAEVAPHVLDDPLPHIALEQGGVRTLLMVPLRRDEWLLGAIVAMRQEVRPFTDKQIALLRNFAAQAVIAMENARLLRELRERTHDLEESLEYQTAASDVLQVISRSTFDLQPVLDTLVQTVVRLCGADWGNLTIRDGEVYRPAAIFGLAPEREAFARKQLYTPGRGTVVGRALLEGTVVHSADMAADPEYASAPGVRYGGTGAVLGVPLLRGGEPLRFSAGTKADRTVHRAADRAGAHLRRSGGHCNRKYAAYYRNPRGVGAADRHRRDIGSHQPLSRQPCASL